jgi:hypothetical protein
MRITTSARWALVTTLAASLSASVLAGASGDSGYASPAPSTAGKTGPQVWSYSDSAYSGGTRVNNVDSTTLDIKVKGYYRIRVYGPDFVKNKTDLLRLFFDTEFPNTGPEYRFTWYLGRTPTPRHVGYTSLRRVEGWQTPNVPKQTCPGMQHHVSFAKDVMTALIPRSCIGHPKQLRWAGYVATVRRYDPETLLIDGPADYFPWYNGFPNFWAG